MANHNDNKIKIFFSLLLLTHYVTTQIISQDQGATNSEVFANISQAFWVDNVAYSLSEAEHIVCLYYKSVAEKQLEIIDSLKLTTSGENAKHQNTSQLSSQSSDDSYKGKVAIEKHLWNIRKNNTRSKINRLLFNRIQLDAKIVGIPRDCSRMVICKEDINTILM